MPASHPDAAALASVFDILDATYGNDVWHWDPDYVRGPMDVIAGAILVQHTTWTNADRALEQLRAADALNAATLAAMPDETLIPLVRISGTPTIKARRLRAIARTIVDARGLDAFLSLPKDDLRSRLLATHGVGPETADGILLYAAAHRTFLIDAYTQRLFRRIGLTPESSAYTVWQRWFEDLLPDATARDFQRRHAHIVLHAKAICRSAPRCPKCPILKLCDYGRANVKPDKKSRVEA